MSADSAMTNDLVPIRDISRMTGVNTVTLRAWERRYGLLKPQRTGKGHRLYSRADIEKVKEIQTWLGRGLAISKVNAILTNKEHPEEVEPLNSVWTEIAEQMRQALMDLQRRPLERLCDELLDIYPAEMIADTLIAPLISELEQGNFSAPSRLAFLNSVLSEQVCRAQHRQRQTAQQQTIKVLSCHANDTRLLPLLFNYCLLVNDFQAEFMGYLSPEEAVFCTQKLSAKLLILMGYEMLDANELQLHLRAWSEQKSLPILLVGRVAAVYRTLAFEADNIVVCDTQQQALQHINSLLK